MFINSTASLVCSLTFKMMPCPPGTHRYQLNLLLRKENLRMMTGVQNCDSEFLPGFSL